MTFVNLSESGYSCSSIDLLNRVVSAGAMNVVRSFMIAGLILWMSSALLAFIFVIVLVVCSSVMCVSWNVGVFVGGSCSSFSSSWLCGIVCVVLWPIVM